jgi:DNA replication protein DnaC
MLDTVINKFKILRLKNCAANTEEIIKQAEKQNLSCLQAFDRLLDIEIEARDKARITLRFKQSKLTEKPTIDQFDFNHHVSRQKQKNLILNLMDLQFVQQKKDIILIGNPGVGKSFIAKCLAYAATQNGIKTLFTSAMDMLNQLIAAEADHSLLKKLSFYQTPDLLVCDEIGYLPLGRQGSPIKRPLVKE